MSENCDLTANDVGKLNTKIQDITNSFTQGIVKSLESTSPTELNLYSNLQYAFNYAKGLEIVQRDINDMKNRAESCISKYKALGVNGLDLKPELETSLEQYSDGMSLSNQLFIDRWEVIIGIFLQFIAIYYIYLNKK